MRDRLVVVEIGEPHEHGGELGAKRLRADAITDHRVHLATERSARGLGALVQLRRAPAIEREERRAREAGQVKRTSQLVVAHGALLLPERAKGVGAEPRRRYSF